MAIQRRFPALLVGFLALFGPGAFASYAAESVSPEFTAIIAPDPEARDAEPLEPPPSPEPSVQPLPVEQPEPSSGSTVPGVAAGPSLPSYPLVLNGQVQHFLDRFTRDHRDAVGLWLSRSSRYLGMIREVLRTRGMPEDLAFTAMIESGFNPVAVSRAGAAGLWQFMAATARRYGLRVDQWVDERFDPEKSTFAAAAYLQDLYKMFGCWQLAQAGYNAGEMTVVRAIRATGTNDFWALARSRFLARETKEFVPQILAATHIARDPFRYGFEAADTTIVSFESIVVPPSTSLQWLADTAGVSVQTLRTLNPSLIRGVTPPGMTYMLKVPLGTGPGILAAVEMPRPPALLTQPSGVRFGSVSRAVRAADVHIVRPRDTVTGIAKHYGVSVSDVVRWNRLEQEDRIRPGDRLRVTDRPGGR